MIVVDASAVLAVLLGQPGYEEIADKLCQADERIISPVSALTAVMALTQKFTEPSAIVGVFFARALSPNAPSTAPRLIGRVKPSSLSARVPTVRA